MESTPPDAADLDQVGAILDVLPHHVLNGRDAVGHAFALHVVLVGQQVFIHVAARYAERRTGRLHVRPGYVAVVDLVAQGDVGEVARTHVAHGRKAGEQGDARVLHPDNGLLGRGHRELEVGIEIGVHREMGVAVDQARQHGRRTEVELAVAGLRGR